MEISVSSTPGKSSSGSPHEKLECYSSLFSVTFLPVIKLKINLVYFKTWTYLKAYAG